MLRLDICLDRRPLNKMKSMLTPLQTRLLALLAVILMASTSHADEQPSLLDYWQHARAEHYVAPAPESLNQLERLFRQTLQTETPLPDATRWLPYGLTLNTAPSANPSVHVLYEQDAPAGLGFYLVASNPKYPVLLQAPHGYKDLETGELLLKLMVEQPFAAGAVNTVPRWYRQGGYKISADFAHLQATPFHAYTEAFAKVYPQGTILQLHGFAQEKRRSAAGRAADVILSAGQAKATPAVDQLHRCLTAALPYNIERYPADVAELGGTTNTIGALLRGMGHEGFVHIEMSYPLRRALLNDASLKQAFGQCLRLNASSMP